MSTRKKRNDDKPTAGHRRTSRPISSRRREEEAPPEPPSIGFSRLEMEQQMADLGKLMAEQDFENEEEANDFLRDLLVNNSGQIPRRKAETAAEKAQELISQAIDAPERRARKLIKDALKLDPNCVDAYVLLGEITDSLPDAIVEFRKAVAAGERTLGPALFKEERGNFWKLMETRPYMRAAQNLANSLWNYGEVDEAVQLFEKILEMNPSDNQGVRYQLLDALILLRRHDEAYELLERFDDGTAHWAYNQALLLFRLEGRSDNAIDALETALEVNEFVPDYLLGLEPMPDPNEMPELMSFGDESEAVAYVFAAFPLWAATPGAQYWLNDYLE